MVDAVAAAHGGESFENLQGEGGGVGGGGQPEGEQSLAHLRRHQQALHADRTCLNAHSDQLLETHIQRSTGFNRNINSYIGKAAKRMQMLRSEISGEANHQEHKYTLRRTFRCKE